MMLFKIPLRNIKRSLRDYAIYFFTLILGVSIFYVFNAIGGQAAMMKVSSSRNDIVKLMMTTISGVSVFVASILAALIVYASRFLMKRRSREFALYMLLGMSKGKISAILLIETVVIGIGSLVAGLFAGIGLSQLMSALVANLFEADMTAYKFSVSGKAIGMTIVYFTVMYAIVMLSNSGSVTKMKLIDLIQSGKKSEKIRLRNPIVCVVIFTVAVLGLGYAYYQVAFNYENLNTEKIGICIALGVTATFMIFLSVAGLLLRVIMRMKKVYHRGLNSFTFRQISSKVSTMVFSMSAICLMLFVTICSLTTAFSVRNSLNSNLKTLCPVDAQIVFEIKEEDRGISEIYKNNGYEVTDGFKDYVHFQAYADESFTLAESLGEQLDVLKKNYAFIDYETSETIVKISDYNNLLKLFGKEPLTLSDDEYIVLCDYNGMKQIRDLALDKGSEITVFGKKLHSKYDKCKDGFICIGAQHLNAGIYVVPDNAVSPDAANMDIFTGNYNAESKEEKQNVEQSQRERIDTITAYLNGKYNEDEIMLMFETKLDIYDAAIGLGAILAFLGLYIGIVFLVACGAILALKELSESVDSIPKYDTLRKIGTDEKDISSSLFRQTGIFFLLPLILAIIHSVFGMKFAMKVMEIFGTEGMGRSIALTSVILLMVYGGYFIVTYINSKWIIRGKSISSE